MSTVVSRLIHPRASISKLTAITTCKNGRLLSTDSNKVDEPIKVEEAETIDAPGPSTDKLLVLGGNGFVGSHICQEALDRGLSVASLSRSGRSSLHDSWANNVTWHQGNLLSNDSWKEALSGVTAVGYYEGKKAAETELLTRFPYGGHRSLCLLAELEICLGQGYSGARIYLRDTKCWQYEDTTRCNRISFGDGFPIYKTPEPGSTRSASIHSSC